MSSTGQRRERAGMIENFRFTLALSNTHPLQKLPISGSRRTGGMKETNPGVDEVRSAWSSGGMYGLEDAMDYEVSCMLLYLG
jgi:hypothetical protein